MAGGFGNRGKAKDIQESRGWERGDGGKKLEAAGDGFWKEFLNKGAEGRQTVVRIGNSHEGY